jgi:thiamine-monophosphate kinase
LSSLGSERSLIDHIRRRLPAAPSSLIVAAGDDAAVAVPERGAFQVLTTDASVEGIHFDRQFSSLSDVGYRAVAVNVSDIAAMGGTPSLALLSFLLPSSTTLADVDALLDGATEMAADARVAIAGGNLSRSPGPLVVDVTVSGSVRPRRILTRSGGSPGDALYLTGSIGAATAGLECLRARPGQPAQPARLEDDLAECIARHRRPLPRTRIGALLGRNRAASACIDLSDGLADAVRQLADASGTGAAIDATAVPVHPGASRWFRSTGQDPLVAAIAGGDDYELLFTVPKKRSGRLRGVERAARGVAIVRIGELTPEREVVLIREGRREPMPDGFSHF